MQSFIEQVVDGIMGRSMVVAHNVMPGGRVIPVGHVRLGDGGKCDGGLDQGLPMTRWAVERGDRLCLYNGDDVLLYSFNGMESRNCTPFITGRPPLSANTKGFERAIMYAGKPIGGFKICVSSHVDYAPARDRLLRSMKAAGVDPTSVVVVVGGCPGFTGQSEHGFECRFVGDNLVGITALACMAEWHPDYDGYWLLLHDTCEVDSDFLMEAGRVEAGLAFDSIRPSPACEVGFYHSGFVRDAAARRVLDRPALADEGAELYINSMCSRPRHVATKDVYGTGTVRNVIYLDAIGVKKFSRVPNTEAKP